MLVYTRARRWRGRGSGCRARRQRHLGHRRPATTAGARIGPPALVHPRANELTTSGAIGLDQIDLACFHDALPKRLVRWKWVDVQVTGPDRVVQFVAAFGSHLRLAVSLFL